MDLRRNAAVDDVVVVVVGSACVLRSVIVTIALLRGNSDKRNDYKIFSERNSSCRGKRTKR